MSLDDTQLEIREGVELSEYEKTLQMYQTRWGRLKLTLRRLWKNKAAILGLAVVVMMVASCTLAPLLTPYDPLVMNIPGRLSPSSSKHLLGTDQFGRDILSRILYGGRCSLSTGIVSVFLGLIPGIFLGLIAGFFRGRVDSIIMRGVDIMMAIPTILLALLIVTVLGPSLMSTMIAVGIGGIPSMIRLVRGQVFSIREEEYIEAAHSIGARDFRIIIKHILPNCAAAVIVVGTLRLPSAIIMAASLSFIGLGVQAPTPEWGAMIASGRHFLVTSWWICTFPGLAIFLAVLGLNMFGDGLRDALDPKLKS
jgi:peptide/nickel transport system permease protein